MAFYWLILASFGLNRQFEGRVNISMERYLLKVRIHRTLASILLEQIKSNLFILLVFICYLIWHVLKRLYFYSIHRVLLQLWDDRSVIRYCLLRYIYLWVFDWIELMLFVKRVIRRVLIVWNYIQRRNWFLYCWFLHDWCMKFWLLFLLSIIWYFWYKHLIGYQLLQ
jgi:hypothetical protein